MKENIITSNPLIKTAVDSLLQYKIEDPVLLDLRDLPEPLTYDYIIICTCRTEIQMKAVLNKVRKNLQKSSLDVYSMEYSPGVKWGILDCSDLVIHIFEKNARKFYSLDRLWADADLIPLQLQNPTAATTEEMEEDEYL